MNGCPLLLFITPQLRNSYEPRAWGICEPCHYISGNQPCHYISGNHVAYERFQRYAKVLKGAGISPERFLWREISAAEGLIFSNTMKELSQKIEDIGIDKIKEENEKARKRISAPLKRKGLIPVIEKAEEEE